MIQPLGRDILLHPIEQPSMRGKIYTPESYKKRPVKGVVISKGSDCEYDEIEIGDVVLVNAYAGEKFSHEGEGIFWLIQESDIECKLLAEPKIRLVDTETVKRLIEEVYGEFVQYNIMESLTPVGMFKRNLINRIDDLTINEGFEF